MKWRSFFAPAILERGLNSFKNGAIESIEYDKEYIKAQVKGEKVYEVDIKFNEGRIVGYDCTCPYAEKSFFCKHMAAAFFYAQSKDDYFKDEINPMISKADIEKQKYNIDTIIREYEGFEDWEDEEIEFDINNFIKELRPLLKREVDKLVGSKQYEAAFDLITYSIYRMENGDIDFFDYDLSPLFDAMEELIKKIFDYADEKTKEKCVAYSIENFELFMDDEIWKLSEKILLYVASKADVNKSLFQPLVEYARENPDSFYRDKYENILKNISD